MDGDAILVDISDPAPVSSTGGQGPLNLLPKKKGRSSFYSLPKTLSEDDDPFGILSFQRKMVSKTREKHEGDGLDEREILREEPSMGLLVQIDADSPKYSISESFNSVSSINSLSGISHLLGVSAITSHQSVSHGASGLGVSGLGTSAHGVSGLFGNLSKISTASQPPGNVTPSFSTVLSDEVFGEEMSQADSKADDEPNWDKLMNEAQFVAYKISDPGVPMKTPVAHSRLAHAMSNYSPCENVESPTAMLDISKNASDNFLVQLTPEKSPKKVLTDDFADCMSPKVAESDLIKSGKDQTEDKQEPVTVLTELNALENIFANIELSDAVDQLEEIVKDQPIPVKKIETSSTKENMEPPKHRIKTDVKKPLLSKPKLSSVSKPKLNLKPSGSITKKVTDVKKTPSSVLKPMNRKSVSATPVNSKTLSSSATSSLRNSSSATPSLRNPILTSASKSLKFTPKNTGFRVAKRPPSSTTSNSEAPVTKTSTTEPSISAKTMPQLKAPLATPTTQPQVPGVKRLNPPKPRSNTTLPAGSKAEPAKPNLTKPSSQSRPSGLSRPSGMARPSAGLNSTIGSLPRPNLGSMPKPSSSGIQRPGVVRQVSSLSQSMVGGSRFSTPSLKRPGVPNRKGLCLPSPQTISANSSLVCSTPAVPRPRPAKGPLPSPITNVKRRV